MAVATWDSARVAVPTDAVGIVRGVIAKDPACEDVFVRQWRATIFCWVWRWEFDKRWVDLITDCALDGLRKALPKFIPGKSSFGTWAWCVIRTEVLMFVRDFDTGYGTHTSYDMLDEKMEAFMGPDDEFVVREVRGQVYKLEGDMFIAVYGYYYEGRTDQEIADLLNITVRQANRLRKRGEKLIGQGLSSITFKSLCPKSRFSAYNNAMTRDKKESKKAQPGGKAGD